MKAKNPNFFILFCMILLMAFASDGFAADAPAMVIQAAKEGLLPFLKQIPRNNLEKFGFTKKEILEEAYTGHPFKLYTITPAALSAYQAGDNIDSVLSETKMWYFPVMFKDEMRAILIVDQMDNEWKAVSLGRAKLAGELARVTKEWPYEKGYHPLLIAVFQAREYLFTVPEKDAYNLTPLVYARAGKKRSGRSSEDAEYSNVNMLSDTIGQLKPVVDRNIRENSQ